MDEIQFKNALKEDDTFSLSWECIVKQFNKLYSTSNHYPCMLHASIGGNDYLQGTTIYKNDQQEHLVTFGMTNLYPDESDIGDKFSGFGYEMTAKWKNNNCDSDKIIYNFIAHHFARYTYTQNAKLFDGHTVICDVQAKLDQLGIKEKSNIKAFVVVNDTEVKTINTLCGEIQFLQLIGITEEELNLVREDFFYGYLIATEIKKDNPLLLNVLYREKNYIPKI